MLLSDKTVAGICAGEVTLVFRRWRRPAAKGGGTQMTQGDIVGIHSGEVVTDDQDSILGTQKLD